MKVQNRKKEKSSIYGYLLPAGELRGQPGLLLLQYLQEP